MKLKMLGLAAAGLLAAGAAAADSRLDAALDRG